MGLLSAIIDAIHGEDDTIGGVAVTQLTTLLLDSELAVINVESTIGFGENTDGAGDAQILVGGEIIQATGRTNTTFTGLTRGIGATKVKTYPQSSVVYDLSRNSSMMDFLYRGFLVNFAVGTDLDIVARNLGVEKCLGLSEAEWREIIKRTAYMPKTPIDSFKQVLDVVFPGAYTITRRYVTDPWTVTVRIALLPGTDKRGRFLLNGGEAKLTTGLLSVDTDYTINHVIGVFLDTPLTRLGYREGFTNFATTNTFAGQTITLDASPGPIGTAVLIDYGAFTAHYIPDDETIVNDGDFWAYLADDTGLARCLLDHVRAAGVRVIVEQM
jgi:hypothetical protein